MAVDVNATLGSLSLDGCVMNAAGAKDITLDELRAIAASGSCAITTKTTTFLPREGNAKPRYYAFSNGTINSSGLPNPGFEQMAKNVDVLRKETKKPIIASMSGFNLEETRAIAERLDQCAADVIEVNLSCPNLKGKPQVAYDPETSRETLETVRKATRKPICVKLSPYPDAVMQDQMADVLEKFKPDSIASINSIGNCLVIGADNRIVLKPKWGGLGGAFIKPLALGNIRRFYERFQGKIPILGIGGVLTGRDAFELVLAGADAIAIGSAFVMEGPGAFTRIQNELATELQRNGYSSLQEAIGQVKSVE